MSVLLKLLSALRDMGHPPIKDFTEEAEERMAKIAERVNGNEDISDKYISDRIGRWLDKNGYLELIYGVNRYQEGVIDCYDYSARNIREICSQARHYDDYYGQAVSSRSSQGGNVVFLVKNLADCLDVNSKHYSPDIPISSRIMGYFSEEINGQRVSVVAGEADRRKENDLAGIDISEDDVVLWSQDEDSVHLFEDYTDYIYEEAMDWGLLDIVFLSSGMVVYKGVEMTLTELISLLSKEGYSEKLVREQLNSIISSAISANKGAKTFMKEHDVAKKAIEERIKAYLDDKDNDGKFKTFVEAMGGIEVIKELADKCPELIDYLYSDYSNGLQILANLAATVEANGSDEMRAALERLRQEYDSKWLGILYKTSDFLGGSVTSLSEEAVKDWIKDNVGDTSVLFTVLDITGLEDRVNGTEKLLTLRNVVNDLQESYESTLEKIHSGQYTEEDVKYAQNIFDMLKEATKNVYEAYRDMIDDPSKKIWANTQIEKINRMNIKYYSACKFQPN